MLITKSKDCPKCGSDHYNDCFATYDNGWHCFSCGASYFQKGNSWSFKPQKLQNTNVYLPPEVTSDLNKMSFEVQEWLLDYHVYQPLIDKYNILYSSYDKFLLKSGTEYSGDSLIFPIVDNTNEIIYYQRRFFPKKQILTVGDTQSLFVTKTSTFCDSVVLVEDYLSAIRIGEFVPSMCLFGTKLKDHHIKYILNNYSHIIIWLDDDEPGKDAATKIYNKLCQEIELYIKTNSYKLIEYKLNKIDAVKQAKEFTNREINDTLESILMS